MHDDYLWDRTGPEDAEVARLESLLCGLRAGESEPFRPRGGTRRKPATLFAIAAAVALAVLIPLLFSRHKLTDWKLHADFMREGRSIDTGTSGSVVISSDRTGEVRIEPNSSLRLLSESGERDRFELRRGSIHALIWSRPGRFVLETPAATAVDLGCSYRMQVDNNHDGLLTVEMGLVALEGNGKESLIPAGASCTVSRRGGPGIPLREDADPRFGSAVRQWAAGANPHLNDDVLALARKQDAITLWHALVRSRGIERQRIVARYRELVKLTPAISDDAIFRGDRTALDSAFNALDLGDISVWRGWEQQIH